MNDIDVSHLDPAAVLAALYNASKPLGLGHLHFTPDKMTVAEAAAALAAMPESGFGGPYFDYVQGRVMKVEINGKTLDPGLYDRDNGEGAAQRAIDTITTPEGA